MSFTDQVNQLHQHNQQPLENNVDFPECRGMDFEEFWDWIVPELEYTDYERELFHILESKKKVRVKKATGLGITTFMSIYVAWKCLKDDEWKNQQIDVSVILITGASQELTNKLIGRIKGLFTSKGKEFKTRESLVIINGCKIEAFPTNHLEPARGMNPRIVWLDEADFFPGRYQDEARTVAERYRAKGDALVFMVSTTNLPGGLYERMDDETDEVNGYVTVEMPYELGLGIVYDPEIIEEEKRVNPSFPREYMLQYGYGMGDIFADSVDSIIQEYDLEYQGGQSGTYADPAFGSSLFGIISLEKRSDGIIYVTEAHEYARESPTRMLDVMQESWERHQQSCKVDAANPGFIKDLKYRGIPAVPVAFGQPVPASESGTMNQQSSPTKHHVGANKPQVNTTTTLKKKLPVNASIMVKNKQVRIHPQFKKLISQMRAVSFDKMGGIDKSEVPFDLVDAFDMGLWDMQSTDYSSIGIKQDGTIYKDNSPKSTSVKVQTVKYE